MHFIEIHRNIVLSRELDLIRCNFFGGPKSMEKYRLVIAELSRLVLHFCKMPHAGFARYANCKTVFASDPTVYHFLKMETVLTGIYI